jgi:hypothetical protein
MNMSTKQELLDTAVMLGIKGVTTKTPLAELRSMINAKLGNPDLGTDDQDGKDAKTDSYAAVISKAGPESVAKATGAVTAKPHNIPNLAPTGIWEGKRAKVRRVKTGHNDMNGAIFNWNGYPCIIPIDVDVDIPWPIFGIMQQCVGMEMEIRQEDDPRDKGKVRNIKNITYYDKYPYQYKGVTPGTEDLPESPWEYTLDQYVDDFPGFTVRMWRQLCILWEISDAQAKIVPGVSPEEEMETRRNAVHYLLNLPQDADADLRQKVRDEKRSDIGLEERAA